MPIRFRCQHCRQFLGISQAQAGLIVDCPMCGRAVRVPHVDGRLDPLPPPQLDLQDARLQHALDELASIAAAPRPQAAAATAAQNQPEDPVPLTAAEPVEPPARQPESASRLRHGDGESSLTEILEELASIAPAQAAVSGTEPLGDEGRVPWGMLLLLIAFSVTAFAGGFLVGRISETDPDLSPPERAATAREETQANTPAIDTAHASASVLGRLTYRTAEGDSRADRGARVFALPEAFTAEEKILVAAVQGEPGSAAFRQAVEQFRAIGGDVAIADEDGAFALRLSEPGVYTVLALSNYQPRPADQEIEPGVQSLLERYFDRPDRVLGGVQYRAGPIRYSGTGTLRWDYSFERP